MDIEQILNSENDYSIDDVEDMICRTQADIYIQAQRDGYDIESFSDAYLSSHFCSQYMDRPYSRFQTEFANACLELIYPEIKDALKPANKLINEDIIDWVGYMYRALYLKTGIPSKELQSRVPFWRLARTYGLHVEDDSLILEDLIRIFKLNTRV